MIKAKIGNRVIPNYEAIASLLYVILKLLLLLSGWKFEHLRFTINIKDAYKMATLLSSSKLNNISYINFRSIILGNPVTPRQIIHNIFLQDYIKENLQ